MIMLNDLDKIVVELHDCVNSSSNAISEKRKQLRTFLQNIYGEIRSDLSLSETIEKISSLSDKSLMRNSAMILLRVISVRGALPDNTSNNRIDLRLSLLFDRSIPDVYKRFIIDESDYTFAKIKHLELVHSQLCKRINSLKEVESTLRSIIGSRQKIQKILTDKALNSYLQQYDFKHIQSWINNIFIQLATYDESPDIFFEEIPSLLEDLKNEKKYCEDNSTFVTRDYYIFFINKLEESLIEE